MSFGKFNCAHSSPLYSICPNVAKALYLEQWLKSIDKMIGPHSEDKTLLSPTLEEIAARQRILAFTISAWIKETEQCVLLFICSLPADSKIDLHRHVHLRVVQCCIG